MLLFVGEVLLAFLLFKIGWNLLKLGNEWINDVFYGMRHRSKKEEK